MSAPRIVVVGSEALAPVDRAALDALCSAAFAERWDGYWDRLGPAVHVLARGPRGDLLGHAALVERALSVGERQRRQLRSGYVEAVAARPDRQGGGIGTAVMTEMNRLIRSDYELGALATGSHHFYERLGWERWRGITGILQPDGRLERTPRDDGAVMILRTPRTPPDLDLAAPIAGPPRAGDPW